MPENGSGVGICCGCRPRWAGAIAAVARINTAI
jgi:hypothetical protein